MGCSSSKAHAIEAQDKYAAEGFDDTEGNEVASTLEVASSTPAVGDGLTDMTQVSGLGS
jgi:hypothetical protein